MTRKRFYLLDGLRGVAAVSVILWHWRKFALIGQASTGLGPTPLFGLDRQPCYALLFPFYQAGWLAVDLFFTLSGFIFFWLYASQISSKHLSFPVFALWRFSRLYPLQGLTLIFAAAGQALMIARYHSSFIYSNNTTPEFILHALLLNAWIPGNPHTFNGPDWSVSIEVLLYLLFFALGRANLRTWPQIILIATLAVLGIVLIPYSAEISQGLINFFMGGLTCTAYRWLVQDDMMRTAKDGARMMSLALLTIVAWVLVLRGYPDTSGTWGALPFEILLFPLTILTLALMESLPLSFLRAGVCSWLGDISFSIYLLHFPLQLLLALVVLHFKWSPMVFTNPQVMLGFFLVLALLGTASHYAFERPVQALLRKLHPRDLLPEYRSAPRCT